MLDVCACVCAVSLFFFLPSTSPHIAISDSIRGRPLHLVEQQIHLLLHAKDVRRLALLDLLVRDPPPATALLALAPEARARARGLIRGGARSALLVRGRRAIVLGLA